MTPRPVLWIVVPCFNEEAVLPVTAPLFLQKLKSLTDSGRVSASSRVLFVNDGSKDQTWPIIKALSDQHQAILGISLSRNRGHQNALLAGLMEAKDHCDITVSIDCDGQDDIDAMDRMIDAYLDGCEVVYGVRSRRETDTWFKRSTAEGFYRLMNALGAEVVYNHADYRLVSSLVLRQFADFGEVNIFLRGMFPLVGFKSTCVYYERAEMMAGESHYPIRKMLQLALNGITSLSIKPINIIAAIGAIFSVLGIMGSIWAIFQFIAHRTVHGWASLFCIVCLLGGLQLLSLGIIGQYVGKTYMEAKHRPRYIIAERTWQDSGRVWMEEKGQK